MFQTITVYKNVMKVLWWRYGTTEDFCSFASWDSGWYIPCFIGEIRVFNNFVLNPFINYHIVRMIISALLIVFTFVSIARLYLVFYCSICRMKFDWEFTNFFSGFFLWQCFYLNINCSRLLKTFLNCTDFQVKFNWFKCHYMSKLIFLKSIYLKIWM